jgi:four helix bundle protein
MMRDAVTLPGPAVPSRSRAAVPDAAPVLLDAERLEVYLVALEFQALAAGLRLGRGLGELRDQLDRASTSIVLNIAEGSGRQARPDKGRFYAIARGSATECAAIIDVVRARGLAPSDVCAHGRGLLVRIVQMLTRLVQRMASGR